MKIFTRVFLAVLVFIPGFAQAQQAPAPAGTPTSPTPGGQPGSSSSRSTGNSKAIPSYLIIGTVFDEKTLSFPGVQVRIRRSGEKKFRWETYTNSRGEFAVRVPPGVEYEVVTHIKNYEDQKQNVDGKVDVQQRLSIKLEPRGQAKTGAKP
jgi:hypothetical protein